MGRDGDAEAVVAQALGPSLPRPLPGPLPRDRVCLRNEKASVLGEAGHLGPWAGAGTPRHAPFLPAPRWLGPQALLGQEGGVCCFSPLVLTVSVSAAAVVSRCPRAELQSLQV